MQVGYRRDQYKRCANLLEAVSQLLEYFNHYQDVPKIQSLTKRLATVQVGAEGGLEQQQQALAAATERVKDCSGWWKPLKCSVVRKQHS